MNLPKLLIDFFNSLNELKNESLKRTFEGDFSDGGKFTILCQKFVENDETLIKQVLPVFIDYLKDEENQKSLLSVEKELINNELNVLYQKLEKQPDKFYEYQIEHKRKELSELSMLSLKDSAFSIFDEILSEIEGVKNNPNTLTPENYFYTKALDILYKKFNLDMEIDKKYKKTSKEENKLYKYYKSLDINIGNKDRQFKKYDLLSINSPDQLIIGLPSRVFDRENSAQFLIDIPEHLLSVFRSLMESSEIREISFLVESDVVFETSEQYFVLLGNQRPEDPITLTSFLNDVRDNSVTKHILKSPESKGVFPAYTSAGRFIENNDSAWYFIDRENIYLEEMMDDAEVLDDCAITQLIHIEYYMKNSEIYISHIDHEYIFYSYDEFDKRQKDFSQKGSARKRIKTFKIDGSRVPLISDGKVLFLNTILECYFKKPYLLNGLIRDLIKKANN